MEKIYGMLFSKVYSCLIAKVAKAERKNRTREEVDEITCWLTGYSKDDIKSFLESDLTYGNFF